MSEPIIIEIPNEVVTVEMTPEGKDGRSFALKGAWENSESYQYLDLVSYNGSSYIALKPVPAGTLPTNTEYWMVNASGAIELVWGAITGTLSDQTDLQGALDLKADAADVYTKTEADDLLSVKADADDVYTKTETDNLLSDKADVGDSYTKAEADTLLSGKADKTDTYTEAEVDALLAVKADADDVYTKAEADALLADKADTDDLGALATRDSISYESNCLTDKPTLGALASQNSIDYTSAQLTNKPTLGTMASENDAPSDGKTYGRKDGDWSEVVTNVEWGDIGGTLSDQTDLQNALNAKANTANLGDMASEDDAPSDNKKYGRKNGDWVEVTEGGGGGSSVWGDISGTLSDQTDLQAALNAKADISSLGALAGKDKANWNTDLTNVPSTFPPSAHNHDDRYYTETEMDTALALKANSADVYSKSDVDTAMSAKANTADLGDLASKDTVDWTTDITNKPASFPPSTHTHDDRYYTEGEIDTALSGKSNTGHTHTMSDVTDLPTLGALAEKDTVDYDTDIDNLPTLGDLADHDTVDYETEVTNKPTLGALAEKDTVDWDTDIDDIPSTFPPSSHTHGNITNGGAISSDTAVASGDKLVLADASDSSKLIRSEISFDGSTTTKGLTPKGTWESFAAASHNHDDRYYTETEIDNSLALKANNSIIADAFSTSTAYAVGDYVIYQGVLYRFTSAHSAGAWASGDVTAVVVGDELERKANTADLGNLATQNTVDYSTEVTNKPTLGTLASKSSVDYSTSEVTNKPTLGTMAAINDAPSDGDEYVRKNGAWAIASGGGGGGADPDIIADEFNASTAYAIGDLVIHSGGLYKFTSAHSAGAWDSSEVSSITVDDAMVKKTGDTMTGDLLITKAHPAEITVRNTSMDTTASTGQVYSNIRFEDVNSKLAGFIQCFQEAKRTQIQISARRVVSGTNKTSTLVIRNDNGTEQIDVSSPAAWRTAFGLGSLATATSSGLIPYTNSSKFSGTIKYIKFGNLCQLFLNGISLLADVDDSSWFNIGTIPSGYRPNMQIHQIFLGSDSADFGRFCIDSTGSMNVKAAYGGTITAGTSYWFTVTYIIY